MAKPKTPESIILTCVRDWLGWQGWMVIRNQQGLGSKPGMPDLTALKGGRVLWIEVKAGVHTGKTGKTLPAGQLSDPQKVFAAEIERHGGEFLLVRSVEDLERYLVPQAAKLERMQVGG